MTDLIKQKTAEEICNHRHEALRLLGEAVELIRQADEHAKSACGDRAYWLGDLLRTYSLGADSVDKARANLDASVWRSIFDRTGLGSLFDSTRAEQFRKQLEEDPPPVSIETVMATALDLSARADQIFEESVTTIFRGLSRRHKSNSGFSFGSRIIFDGVLKGHGLWWEDTIRDLERITYTVSGKAIPDRRDSVHRQIDYSSWRPSAGEIENEMFRLKWFKNGNLHVHIIDEDVIRRLNAILADNNLLGHAA